MHPDFFPALVEKMRICLSLQDWEQTIETANRFDTSQLLIMISQVLRLQFFIGKH